MTKEIKESSSVDTVVEEKKPLKGREESIIKYAFITLGGILLISIIAFIIVSVIPERVVSVGDRKISSDEFVYYYKHQADLILDYKENIAPDVEDYTFLMSEYTNGITYSQAAAQRAVGVILETYVMNDLANGGDEEYTYDQVEKEEALESFKADFENYAKENDIKHDDLATELYGCNYKTLQNAYLMSWVATKYQTDMIAKYEKEVTEDAKLEYYESFKDDLDSVTVQHILIPTFDATTGADYDEDQIAAAKAKTEEAYDKVMAGDDFLEVAIAYSEDPSVAESEAKYTFKNEENGLTEFTDWAFTAEIDDVGFVESSIGFHVIKLIDRTSYEDLADTAQYNLSYGNFAKYLDEIESTDEYVIGYFDAYYGF